MISINIMTVGSTASEYNYIRHRV